MPIFETIARYKTSDGVKAQLIERGVRAAIQATESEIIEVVTRRKD